MKIEIEIPDTQVYALMEFLVGKGMKIEANPKLLRDTIQNQAWKLSQEGKTPPEIAELLGNSLKNINAYLGRERKARGLDRYGKKILSPLDIIPPEPKPELPKEIVKPPKKTKPKKRPDPSNGKKSLQEQAWALKVEGKTLTEIGTLLNKEPNRISSYLWYEKKKRGLEKYPFSRQKIGETIRPRGKGPSKKKSRLGNIHHPEVNHTELFKQEPEPPLKEIGMMTTLDLSKIIDDHGNLLIQTRPTKVKKEA